MSVVGHSAFKLLVGECRSHHNQGLDNSALAQERERTTVNQQQERVPHSNARPALHSRIHDKLHSERVPVHLILGFIMQILWIGSSTSPALGIVSDVQRGGREASFRRKQLLDVYSTCPFRFDRWTI